jgi:hypothetical protein
MGRGEGFGRESLFDLGWRKFRLHETAASNGTGGPDGLQAFAVRHEENKMGPSSLIFQVYCHGSIYGLHMFDFHGFDQYGVFAFPSN